MKDGLYVFSADSWCSQCKQLKGALKHAGIEFETIDADSDNGVEFGMKYRVRSMPTSFIFKDGEIVKTIVGVKPVSEYIVELSN